MEDKLQKDINYSNGITNNLMSVSKIDVTLYDARIGLERVIAFVKFNNRVNSDDLSVLYRVLESLKYDDRSDDGNEKDNYVLRAKSGLGTDMDLISIKPTESEHESDDHSNRIYKRSTSDCDPKDNVPEHSDHEVYDPVNDDPGDDDIGNDEIGDGDIGDDDISSETKPNVENIANEPECNAHIYMFFKCAYCSMTFALPGKLTKHVSDVHRKNISNNVIAAANNRTCPVCESKFASEYNLSKHLKSAHTKEKPYMCNKCNRCYKTVHNLKDHLNKRHTGYKKKVASDQLLAEARIDNSYFDSGFVRKITSSGVYVCSFCKGNFTTAKELRSHVNEAHSSLLVNADAPSSASSSGTTPSRDASLVCTLCNNKFKSVHNLKKHLFVHTTQRSFECGICNVSYKTCDTLTQHLKKHTGNKPHECTFCGKRFMTNACRISHELVHTNERPFPCTMCKQRFKQRGALTTHMHIHLKLRPHSCSVCGRKMRTKSAINDHMKLHKAKPCWCNVCGNGFITPKELERHSLIHKHLTENIASHAGITATTKAPEGVVHNLDDKSTINNEVKIEFAEQNTAHGRAYECSCCNMSFRQLPALSDHVRDSHASDLMYNMINDGRDISDDSLACLSCGKLFATANCRKHHERITHSEGRPYRCGICGRSYKASNALKIHMHTHTGKPFKCPTCPKSFITKAGVRYHQRMHTGDKPFTCTVCGKAFKQSGHLAIHMALHTGTKTYQCPLCGKLFAHSPSLKRHMATHSPKEKHHKCPICKKLFVSRTILSYHSMIHTGIKPQLCNICPRRFRLAVQLRSHMRVHTGEKPFKCPHCGDSFRKRSTLKCHLQTHTDERPFSCIHCGGYFKYRLTLNRHIKKFHQSKKS